MIYKWNSGAFKFNKEIWVFPLNLNVDAAFLCETCDRIWHCWLNYLLKMCCCSSSWLLCCWQAWLQGCHRGGRDAAGADRDRGGGLHAEPQEENRWLPDSVRWRSPRGRPEVTQRSLPLKSEAARLFCRGWGALHPRPIVLEFDQ